MHIDIIQIALIVIFGSLFYWANNKINVVPTLREVISVVIVIAAVLLLVASLFGRFPNHIDIH